MGRNVERSKPAQRGHRKCGAPMVANRPGERPGMAGKNFLAGRPKANAAEELQAAVKLSEAFCPKTVLTHGRSLSKSGHSQAAASRAERLRRSKEPRRTNPRASRYTSASLVRSSIAPSYRIIGDNFWPIQQIAENKDRLFHRACR